MYVLVQQGIDELLRCYAGATFGFELRFCATGAGSSATRFLCRATGEKNVVHVFSPEARKK